VSADRLRDWAREIAANAGLGELKDLLARVESAAGEGKLEAEVWTAVPLEAAERSTLEQRLRERFGEELDIAYHLEPAILGGVIVRVGDRYLDGSLASKLGQLRQELVTGRMA
jgi:F-type H+-transporting ATPase subunit delta